VHQKVVMDSLLLLLLPYPLFPTSLSMREKANGESDQAVSELCVACATTAFVAVLIAYLRI